MRARRDMFSATGEENTMNRAFLAMAVTAGAIAAAPVIAQQSRESPVPPNQKETVPVQLKAEQIKELQQRLNKQGFSSGNVDGIWGPDTSAAVMNFQARNGLQPTGQLDQKTLKALDLTGVIAGYSAAPPQTTIILAPSNPPATGAVGAVDRTLGTDMTGTNPDANAPDGTPGNPPGTAASRATDRTLGTDMTGTNSGGANAGTNAAGGDTNQAVATTNANAPQPASGANSFSMGEARRRIANRGFQNVNDLRKDTMGVWRGTATKDGQQVQVWLDYKGNVGQ